VVVVDTLVVVVVVVALVVVEVVVTQANAEYDRVYYCCCCSAHCRCKPYRLSVLWDALDAHVLSSSFCVVDEKARRMLFAEVIRSNPQ